jgi:nitric oxide reductase large subunit
MTLFFVILFTQDWVHNGFIALNWLSLPDQPNPYSKTWQASLTLLLVHAFLAVWVAMRLDVWATLGGMGTLLMVLLGNQRKPTIEVVTIVILLVLHPIALVGGLAWKKTKEREGRIRLEEDARGEAEFFEEDD